MASYSKRVRGDIARWSQAGLIDGRTAELLVRDVVANERRGLSFGSILAAMAAVLLGAAILVMVAANWEGIGRGARVVTLFSIIAAGYLGGALLKMRDHPALGEALWLIAAAAFGGSIALIGQMYHLTGDETEAILTWTIGTALAAALLRSGTLTVMAVVLAGSWLVLRTVDFWRVTPFPHLYPVLAAVLWGVSLWTRSMASRHLLLLSLVLYAVMISLHGDVLSVGFLLAAVSAALFAAAIVLPEAVDRVAGLDGALPWHGLFGFLVGMGMVQILLFDDELGLFALASAVVIAGIVAAIVLAGRELRGVRWLGYTAFTIQVFSIQAVLVGSMIGTAGFFLTAGLALAVIAFLIIRLEKRLMAQPLPTGASA